MCDGQHAMNQKQLRVKENRLDKASVRFNGALATNAQLRAMIDHLRRERSVFEGIRKKLQRVCKSMALMGVVYMDLLYVLVLFRS